MTFRQLAQHLRGLFDPRRHYEPTWAEEWSCRWWLFRYALCDWQTKGKHRWGMARQDSLLAWSRSCRRCKTVESLPINTTWGTTASNAKLTFRIVP